MISCQLVQDFALSKLMAILKTINLPPADKEKVEKSLLEFLEKTCGNFNGFTPKTLIGAIIYIETDLKQAEVAELVGCSEVSIRNAYKKLCKILNKTPTKQYLTSFRLLKIQKVIA